MSENEISQQKNIVERIDALAVKEVERRFDRAKSELHQLANELFEGNWALQDRLGKSLAIALKDFEVEFKKHGADRYVAEFFRDFQRLHDAVAWRERHGEGAPF